jgi:hypothetical protein
MVGVSRKIDSRCTVRRSLWKGDLSEDTQDVEDRRFQIPGNYEAGMLEG